MSSRRMADLWKKFNNFSELICCVDEKSPLSDELAVKCFKK